MPQCDTIVAMDSHDPTVSVIITTHDRPSSLQRAIQSVLRQSRTDFELIVVDDASPGRVTEETVHAFHDPKIRYIRNKYNQGGAISLNIGLRAAKGTYIAILDDDDIWVDDKKLSKQIQFLKQHEDYVLVGTNAIVVDAKTQREINRTTFPQNDLAIREVILRNNPFSHSSVLYRRSVAVSIGGYKEKLIRGKDYDLWLRLGMQGKFAILPDHALQYSETLPDAHALVKRRFVDARASAAVVLENRKSYQHFWRAYCTHIIRTLLFSALLLMPFLYSMYRKIVK